MFRKLIPLLIVSAALSGGCATQKESHTSRTGIEQLLVSSAVDQSLDRMDLSPLRRRKVYVETKYLDCVDKNYVIVSLHGRLMKQGATLVDKADEADAVVEVGSGAVGTDGQNLFVGVPEIPLPPPSPISIPKMAVFTRNKMNGTAKLLVVAYDAKTKAPLLQQGPVLARSDQSTWNFMGTGNVTTGSVPDEIAAATGELDLSLSSVKTLARRTFSLESPRETQPPTEIRTTGYLASPTEVTPDMRK